MRRGLRLSLTRLMRWIKDLERWKLLVKEAKEKSASTRDGEPPLVEQNHVLEVPCANAEFGYPANVTCFAMQRHLM
ncbi:unnamed protein product [Brassica oleracea]